MTTSINRLAESAKVLGQYICRSEVSEKQELNTLYGCRNSVAISTLIAELQELREQGWENVETDKYDSYGGEYVTTYVTRIRPETDEEFARRQKIAECEATARAQYLRLKAQFEPEAG